MFDNINTNYEEAEKIIGIHNYEELIGFIENEINNGKNTAEYYAYLSKAYLWKENLEDSLKYAKKSIETDPNYAYGYYRLAYIYYQFEELNSNDAFKYLEKATELKPDDYQNLSLLTQLHYELNNKKEFKEAFKKLTEIENTSADYYYQYARVCRLTDQYKKAVKYLEKAKDYKDKITLYYRLADCYNSAGDNKLAKDYIDRSLELKPVSDSMYLKATCLYEDEDYEKSVECFKAALKMGYDAMSVYNALGFIYHSGLNDDISAQKYFDMAEKLGNLDDRFYEAKGDFLLDLKDYDQAIAMYKKLLENDPRNIEINHALAYCYLFKKEYKEALRCANKTILLDKNFTRAYLLKSQVFEYLGKYSEAIKIYEGQLESNADDLDIAFVYSKVSYCKYRLLEDKVAMDYANKAILLNPQYAYAHQMKGFILLSSNKFDEAIEAFSKSQEIENDVANFIQIGECYRVKGLFRKAIEYSNKALLQDTKNGDAYFIKGNSLLAMGKTKEGEVILKKAQKYGGVFTELI